MSEFEPTIGRWWVADQPHQQAAGYLDLEPEGLGPWRLTVEGELAEPTGPGIDVHQTIYGVTPQGEFTLERAGTTLSTEGHTSMQQWRGWQLIKGGHVTPSQRFPHITFRLPHLWHWLGPSKLNHHSPHNRFRAKPDDNEDKFLTAHLPDGLNLSLGPTFTKARADTGESWTGYGVYVLEGDPGANLDELDQVTLALSRLHSIVTATPMETYQVQLRRDMKLGALEILDPHPPAGLTWGDHRVKDPFLDTAEINFEPFIKAWMLLHKRATTAVAVAAPRDDKQFLTSKLVDTCNGLEALAAHVLGEPMLQEDDEAVLQVLKDAGCNRKLREGIKFCLLMRRRTLEEKLIQLAAKLGPESATWLLGPSISDWAQLVAGLRNSLAHGFQLPGGLSDDIPFIVTAQRSAVAVLRLALLSNAGYTNPMSSSPGELLWWNGRKIMGHPNSSFFHEVESIAADATHWAAWQQRLRPHP
jgi:hypothetical protein